MSKSNAGSLELPYSLGNSYSLFIEKMFSLTPYGIGIRELFMVEQQMFALIFSRVDEEEAKILGSHFMTFYRTGRTDTIPSEYKARTQQRFEVFIQGVRQQLTLSPGVGSVLGSIIGDPTDTTCSIDMEIDMYCAEVNDFNMALNGRQVFDDEGILLEEIRQILIHYIQRGVAHPEIMYLQNIMYQDCDTDFTFDNSLALICEIPFYWKNWIDPPRSAYLDYKDLYFLKYLDYETIESMKYCSKYCYEVFQNCRRLRAPPQKKMIDHLYTWDEEVLENNNLGSPKKQKEFNLLVSPGKLNLPDFVKMREDIDGIEGGGLFPDKAREIDVLLANRSFNERLYIFYQMLKKRHPSIATKWRSLYRTFIVRGGMAYRCRVAPGVKERVGFIALRGFDHFLIEIRNFTVREPGVGCSRMGCRALLRQKIHRLMKFQGWEDRYKFDDRGPMRSGLSVIERNMIRYRSCQRIGNFILYRFRDRDQFEAATKSLQELGEDYTRDCKRVKVD